MNENNPIEKDFKNYDFFKPRIYEENKKFEYDKDLFEIDDYAKGIIVFVFMKDQKLLITKNKEKISSFKIPRIDKVSVFNSKTDHIFLYFENKPHFQYPSKNMRPDVICSKVSRNKHLLTAYYMKNKSLIKTSKVITHIATIEHIIEHTRSFGVEEIDNIIYSYEKSLVEDV